MSWQKYDLVFQLLAPLHIGWRKTGNLQQTRGYVPGKNQWAALTARLTRDYDNGADGKRYKKIGECVQNNFRFTYLYPAVPKVMDKPVKNPDDVEIHYPWDDDFDYLFLDSYASTALNYDHQATAEGLLHETEFIAPYTREGQPVYLTGNLYTQTDLTTPLDKWQEALAKLQLGGERGYGWGRVQLVNEPIGKSIDGEPQEKSIRDNEGKYRIAAHLVAQNVSNVTGPIEPLIGWERNNPKDKNTNGKKWTLSTAEICYAPGANVEGRPKFTIGANGIWQK